jgi:ATP-dependent Clp protease ATP-binding subunit ClpX
MAAPPTHCSFCKKHRRECGPLSAGAHGAICEKCAKAATKAIDAYHAAHAGDGTAFDIVPPKELKAFMDEYVIGQEGAKKALAVAVYDHYLRVMSPVDFDDDVEVEKANIMMIGPTGCGKTLLAKTIARTLNVPFTIADATRLTQAGFVGDDVEDILTPLVAECGGDPRRIERAIVFIDEVDKIASANTTATMTRDVGGRGVQQALLKLLEGSKVRVPLPGYRRLARGGDGNAEVEIDTSNILFIVGGAFPALKGIIEKRVNKKATMGFGSESATANNIEDESDLFENVETEDLKKFGMIPEFLGRIPCVVTLRQLSVDELVEVLTEPRNALLKQKVKELKLATGADLVFEDDAVRAIAKRAIDEGRGARGLRSIVEPLLRDVKYELPSRNGEIAQVVITEDVVLGKGEPVLVPAVAEANG